MAHKRKSQLAPEQPVPTTTTPAAVQPVPLTTTVPAELAPLPSYITLSPLLSKRKLTPRGLPRYTENMLRLFTPELVPRFFEALREKVIKGDIEAIRLCATMFHYVEKTGGVSVVNNLFQTNGNGTGNGRTFDAIASELVDSRKATITLPPQAKQLPE